MNTFAPEFISTDELRTNVRNSILRAAESGDFSALAGWFHSATRKMDADSSFQLTAEEQATIEEEVEHRLKVLREIENLTEAEVESRRAERLKYVTANTVDERVRIARVQKMMSWLAQAVEDATQMEAFLDWFQEHYNDDDGDEPTLPPMNEEQQAEYDAICARWPRTNSVFIPPASTLDGSAGVQVRMVNLMLTLVSRSQTGSLSGDDGWYMGELVLVRDGEQVVGEELEEIIRKIQAADLNASHSSQARREAFQDLAALAEFRRVTFFSPTGRYYSASSVGLVAGSRGYSRSRSK